MAHLSLSLLGRPQARLDGVAVAGFESQKVRALLAYLALEADRPHARDALAGLLWPEQPDHDARNNLRQALVQLAAYYERRGDDAQAQQYVWRVLDLDPWREQSHRQLMRMLARSGQRSAALMQYATCRRVLAEELGVDPEAETTALYEQ